MKRLIKLHVFMALVILSGGLNAKSLLWKVESGKGNMYLLGSLHLLKKSHYPLDEKIEKAFEKADVLILEVHPDSMETPQAKMKMLKHAMFSDGSTLQESLSDSTYATTKRLLAEMGMPIESLNAFQPWFVAVTMSVLKLQALGFDPQYGIDQYFFNKAGDREVQAFETVDDQLALFSGMSDSLQNDLLLQTISEMEIIEAEIDQMLNAWQKGDAGKLDKLMLESFRMYPDIYERFLVNRNITWMEKIRQYLDQDKTFFIICGAGHLVGEDGVIRMLKKEGHKLKQL